MSSIRARVMRAILLTVVAMAALVAPAAARTPVDPTTLTPPPPDFFNATCERLGGTILCDLHFSDPPVTGDPSGIVCGGIELTYSQTRDVVGKRFYDLDGNLRRRHFREDIAGRIVNPVTSRWVSFVQQDTIVHDLGVPGDIGTGTTRITGTAFKVTAPSGRTVLSDAGRVVIDESTGEILASSGPHRLDAYFGGDPHALDALCAAVA